MTPAATPSTPAAPQAPASAGQHDPLYVAWMRDQQRKAHRRESLLHEREAKADPSEAAGIAGPITSWAEGHAREKRRHDSALAGLRAGSSHGQIG